MSDKSTEQMIQESGATAPRLNPQHIESTIVDESYVNPTGTLTVCVLTLRNGTLVTGGSACVGPENFNAEIGRKVAREDAFRKIWALEGYLLKERLYQASLPSLVVDRAPDPPELPEDPKVQSVLTEIIGHMATKLSVPKEKITPDSRIKEDLGADSLDKVGLVINFEDLFHVEISDDEADNVSTVMDAAKLIASKIPSSL